MQNNTYCPYDICIYKGDNHCDYFEYRYHQLMQMFHIGTGNHQNYIYLVVNQKQTLRILFDIFLHIQQVWKSGPCFLQTHHIPFCMLLGLDFLLVFPKLIESYIILMISLAYDINLLEYCSLIIEPLP